jgi:hypothetical protein
MGKKKDERKRREREADRAATGGCGHKHDAKHDGAKHDGRKHDGATPFAGIAAAVTRQLGTPAGRQVVAAGLMMAAAAISKQDAKTAARAAPPAPPEPPVTPEAPASSEARAKPADEPTANPYAGDTPEPPRGETPPLPPEMAKVLGAVTAGLETLFAGFGKPRNGPPKA